MDSQITQTLPLVIARPGQLSGAPFAGPPRQARSLAAASLAKNGNTPKTGTNDLPCFVKPGEPNPIGDAVVSALVECCSVWPDSLVLEIGSGSGRIAQALLPIITKGTYVGLDCKHSATEWCMANIHARRPNFVFRHMDVHNPAYNPDSPVDAATATFPYADGVFDIVFLISVFTHMRPPGVERYIREIARMLRLGGKLMATCYLLSERREEWMTTQFGELERDGAALGSRKVFERAVGYNEGFIESRIAQAGMEVRMVDHDFETRWPKQPIGQDLIVAERVENKETIASSATSRSGLSGTSPGNSACDPDLALLVERWDTLPQPVRAEIVAMVRSAASVQESPQASISPDEAPSAELAATA